MRPTLRPAGASLLIVEGLPMCWWLPPPKGCSTGCGEKRGWRNVTDLIAPHFKDKSKMLLWDKINTPGVKSCQIPVLDWTKKKPPKHSWHDGNSEKHTNQQLQWWPQVQQRKNEPLHSNISVHNPLQPVIKNYQQPRTQTVTTTSQCILNILRVHLLSADLYNQ